MENMSQGTPPVPGRNSSSKKWLYLSLAGVGAIAVLLLWVLYLGPDAQRARELDRNYDIAMNTITNFEEAMRNDTYGGETPEETLELFIHALDKEDVELAGRYFLLKEDGSQDEETLNNLRAKQSQLKDITETLRKAEAYEEDRIDEDDYKFVVRNENGEMIAYIVMQRNVYSNVWKIVSL